MFMKSSVNMRFVIQVLVVSKIMFCAALGFNALAERLQSFHNLTRMKSISWD